jgi:hypothetical protein
MARFSLKSAREANKTGQVWNPHAITYMMQANNDRKYCDFGRLTDCEGGVISCIFAASTAFFF